MKVPSSRLANFARVVQGAILTGGETEQHIPPVIQPTFTLADPYQTRIPLSSSTVQNTSFFSRYRGFLNNQAAVAVEVATFGRGLWHVFLMFTQAANFTRYGLGSVTLLQLRNPSDVETWELVAHPINNAFHQLPLFFEWTFAEDGWDLFISQPVTGVAENLDTNIGIDARKVL